MIEEIFSDPKWRLSNAAVCYPNKLAVNHEKAGAVVVLQRADGRGADYALNVAGLEYVIAAELDGRITAAYVVLGRQGSNGQPPSYIAHEKATVARDRLRDVPARQGQFGPYWWVTTAFVAAASYEVLF